MGTHPLPYPPLPDVAVPTFDWRDIADGTGIVEFYCQKNTSEDSAAGELFKEALDPGYTDPTTVDSWERVTYLSDNNAQFKTSEFHQPATIRGDMHVSGSYCTSTTHNEEVTLFINVFAENPGTDEIIEIEKTIPLAPANHITTFNELITIPKKHFKVGDKLGINFYVGHVGGNDHVFLFHDPINRDIAGYNSLTGGGVPAMVAATNPTKLLVYVPFEIDLK